jgi:hypothetical protein
MAAVFTSLAVKRLFAPARLRWFVLTVCLLLALAVSLAFLSRPSRPAPFLVLHRHFAMPFSLRDRLLQRIPATPSWAWFWRLQDNTLNGSTNDVGFKMDCLARVRSQSTDLFVNVTLSELLTNPVVTAAAPRSATLVSIRTNLDIAARLQVPKGSGVLLLDGAPGEANRKVLGVMIDPP